MCHWRTANPALVMKQKPRTTQQNRALYLYFRQISNLMNENGYTIEMLINNGFQLHVSEHIIKQLWLNIQNAMYGDESTTKLTTEKINKIYDVFNKQIGEAFGEHIPFPSIDEIINKQREY